MVPLLVLRDRMIGSIQFYTLLLRKPQQQLLLSHSDPDRLIKPSRVGTHRQQNPILSSTLSTNEALSTHECMGSSPTSYNDNHMDDSSHSHPNDTPSCEPCPPPHTVHLPSIICNHSPPSFHCSTSGRCLSSLDEQ